MRHRHGFTLVELMVSMALIMFVMVIMTEAFTAGLGAFRQLKAVGDMQEKLRVAATILRQDLGAYHFLNSTATTPYVRLSDPTISGPSPAPLAPPNWGFFYIRSPQLVSSNDQDSVPYYQPQNAANLPLSIVHFTVQQQANGQAVNNCYFGRDPSNTFTTSTYSFSPDYLTAPNTTVNSQWAEVIYFLQANGASTSGGLPLFTLYRRQAVIMSQTSTTAANGASISANQRIEISYQPQQATLTFNAPVNVGSDSPTKAVNRYLLQPYWTTLAPYSNSSVNTAPATLGSINSAYAGDDLLLSNVVSLTISVLPLSTTAQTDSGTSILPPASPYYFQPLSNFVTITSGTNAYEYDTALPNLGATGGLPQIGAIQITIQIWDIKTEQSRQVTVIEKPLTCLIRNSHHPLGSIIWSWTAGGNHVSTTTSDE